MKILCRILNVSYQAFMFGICKHLNRKLKFLEIRMLDVSAGCTNHKMTFPFELGNAIIKSSPQCLSYVYVQQINKATLFRLFLLFCIIVKS